MRERDAGKKWFTLAILNLKYFDCGFLHQYSQRIYEYRKIIIPTSAIVQPANSVVSKNLVLRVLAENTNKGTIY